MDINDFRSVVTLAGLVLFLALVANVWSKRRKAEYDDAAKLPFDGEALESAAIKTQGDHS